MKTIEVKRIEPLEMPADMFIRLMQKYCTNIQDFVVIIDDEQQVLYVNNSVKREDIEGFLKYISYSGNCIGEDLADFADYVCEKYGYSTYRILYDSYVYTRNEKCERIADELAAAAIPLIEKEAMSENPIIKYNERLIHKVWKAGYDPFEHKTPENLTNYGSVYVFYLGYLMGVGLIKESD